MIAISPPTFLAENLFSPTSSVKAWDLELFTPYALNKLREQSDEEVEAGLSQTSSAFEGPQRLFVIPQENSRGSLKISRQSMTFMQQKFNILPNFNQMLHSFARDGSDTYMSRSALYFRCSFVPTERFEFCCLLKFVAKHDRPAPTVVKTSLLNEVQQWSIRQQALYHSIDLQRQTKHMTTILVNPSICVWNSIKAEFSSSRPALKKTASWATPILVLESLTIDWGNYVGALHRAVELLKLDAQSTNPGRPNIGETDSSSLKTALEVMDRLRIASHVLESNISTILAIHREVETCPVPWNSSKQFDDKLRLLHCVEEVTRQLEFQQSHVSFIMSRLEAVTMMVRDLINVRNTLTMEKMTARTIREARTMRVIALLTLCFLPPTFIAGFLDMDYIKILTNNGKIKLQLEPGLWLYLAIALPLVVIIMSSYLWWDKRKVKKSVSQDNYV